MAKTKKVNEMITVGLGPYPLWNMGYGAGNNYQGEPFQASGGAGAANSSFLKRYQDISALADQTVYWGYTHGSTGEMQIVSNQGHSNIRFGHYIGPTQVTVSGSLGTNFEFPEVPFGGNQNSPTINDSVNNTYPSVQSAAGADFGHHFADHHNVFWWVYFAGVGHPANLRMG